MLFVEVEIPILYQTYDFKVAKKERVEKVLEDMIVKICQKESLILKGDKEKALLWDTEQGKILPRDWTMEECGVKNGRRLLLI